MKTYGVLQPACGPHFNYIFTLEHSTPEDHLTADFFCYVTAKSQ